MRGLTILFLILTVNVFAYSGPDLKRLREHASLAPQETLVRLDSLNQNEHYPEYVLDYLRACAYFKLSMFEKSLNSAEKAFHNMEIRSDTTVYRNTYMVLAESAVFAYSLGKAAHYIQEGKKYAHEISDDVLLATILLSEGDLYRRLGVNTKAYECVFKSIRLLYTKKSTADIYHLSHAYGFLMRYYINDGKYASAWRVGKIREKVLQYLDKPLRYDLQCGFLYSKMAFLAYQLGREEDAESYNHRFQQTNFSKTAVGRLEINDYLLSTHNYGQVVDNAKMYFHEMDKRDTLNLSYVRLLEQATAAYEAMENYSSAYYLAKRLLNVQKSMRMNNERTYLLEQADLFQTMNAKNKLSEFEHLLKDRKFYLLLLLLLSVLLLLCIFGLYWENRIIRRRNKKMTALILEVEKRRLQKEGAESVLSKSDPAVEASGDKQTEAIKISVDKESSSVPLSDEDLFAFFDKKVRSEKLFLDYQLGRDDYARIMKVDKNRFAALMKEYGGVHLNAYLNNLRLEHSVMLFHKYPDWSINEIASQSALPNLSTFYRLFKEKYGISPNTFRSQLKNQ